MVWYGQIQHFINAISLIHISLVGDGGPTKSTGNILHVQNRTFKYNTNIIFYKKI